MKKISHKARFNVAGDADSGFGAHPSFLKIFPVPGGDKKTKRVRGRRRGAWNTGIAAPYADYRLHSPSLPNRCRVLPFLLNIEFRSRLTRGSLDERRTSGTKVLGATLERRLWRKRSWVVIRMQETLTLGISLTCGFY